MVMYINYFYEEWIKEYIITYNMTEHIPYGRYTNPRTFKCKNCGEKEDSHGRSYECTYMSNKLCTGIDKWGEKCYSIVNCIQMIKCISCCEKDKVCSRCGTSLKNDTYFNYKRLK